MLSLLLVVFVTFFSLSNAFIQQNGNGYRRYIQLNMIDNINDKKINSNIARVSSMFIALTLPSLMNTMILPQVAYADKSYLEQPTAEFIEETKKTAAKREADLKVRKEWDAIIDTLKSSDTAAGKEASLRSLQNLLKKYDNGIPTGVKKLEVVKLCRSLKYDDPLSKKKRTVPSWTTPVEIAYEDFIKEFNKQITPKAASDSKF